MAKKSPAKIAKKSPAKKALVGKQANLPKELRDKILASPAKMLKPAAMKLMKKSPAKKYKSDAQRKAVHASKAEKSPAKLKYKKK